MPKRKNPLNSQHIHRYEKAVLGKDYQIWKCNIPGCSHYIPRKLGKGRLTLCNRCDKEMVLDAFSMQFAKPHCVDCTHSKRENTQGIAKYLEAHDSQVIMPKG
jgi:hypothetical protein